MLPQLIGQAGLQAIDEFMQIAVVMRGSHITRVREPSDLTRDDDG
jgi:hypothetical protein